jgi:hypothetical protein
MRSALHGVAKNVGQRSRRHGPLLYLFAVYILAAPNFNLGLSAPVGDSDSDREAT